MCGTRKGCCGTSLRRTCLVIAIVYLVLNIILFVMFFTGSTGHSINIYEYRSLRVVRWSGHRSLGYVTIINLIFSIITLLICISLIFAASFENAYFIIPWFIGYLATVVQFIIAIGFLGSNYKSFIYFGWQWDFYVNNSSDTSDNFRASLALPMNIYNGTQPSTVHKYKYYFSVWNIYESFVKILIESCLLCYPISYYVELRQSQSETDSSNR